MRRASSFLVAAILGAAVAGGPATASPVAAQGTQTIAITSYDVTSTPMSGYGCWHHAYDGSIVDTGRSVSLGACESSAPHLANYSGGSGTLNDGVVSTTIDDDHLFLTSTDDDGLPIEPTITLHLAQEVFVTGIAFYGGELAWNFLPGLLDAVRYQIGRATADAALEPFGPENAIGVPANDYLDLMSTEAYWAPTDTIVLSDFHSTFFGFPYDQFALAEIVVEGIPAFEVAIDVKPGDRDPVRMAASSGTIPIAILGSADLSVRDIVVDGGSLTFGPMGYEVGLAWNGCKVERVNRDRIPDLICHWENVGLNWQPGPTSVLFEGWTTDGRRFYGMDEVIVVQGD